MACSRVLARWTKNSDRQVLSELPVLAGTGRRIPVGADRALGHRRRAPTNGTLNVVLDHEIHGSRRGRDDRLPTFDRPIYRPWHQRQFRQLVAAVRHVRRQSVVLPAMREAVAVEGLEQDFHLFLEQLAVGGLVLQRTAEGFYLAGVVATANTEHGASLGQDVGDRVVLRQAERVPHRRDVEAAADLQFFGDVRKMHREHEQVGQNLVAFALKVVFGQPQRIPAEPVHLPGYGFGLLEDADELIVGEVALIGGRGILPHVRHVDMARIDGHEFADHVASWSNGLSGPASCRHLLARRVGGQSIETHSLSEMGPIKPSPVKDDGVLPFRLLH